MRTLCTNNNNNENNNINNNNNNININNNNINININNNNNSNNSISINLAALTKPSSEGDKASYYVVVYKTRHKEKHLRLENTSPTGLAVIETSARV